MSIVCYNHAVDKVWQLNHEASPQNTLKHYILKFGKAVSEDQLGNSHHEVDNQSNGNTYQKQLQTDKSRFDMASNLSPTLRKTTKKKAHPPWCMLTLLLQCAQLSHPEEFRVIIGLILLKLLDLCKKTAPPHYS